MPTILRFAGLRVVIYPADHRPPHVHVVGVGGESVFILNCPDGPPELRESYGLDQRALSRVARMVADEVLFLCNAWSRFHGDH